MAEVYGVKPKIFTKDWWPHFWMYYKWHTIIITALVVFLTVWITEYVTRTRYDLKLTYYGIACAENSQWEELCNMLEPYLSDIDSNGETNLEATVLNKSDETTMYQHNHTMHVGFMDSFSGEEMYLYILDKDILNDLISSDFLPDFFIEAEAWLQADLPSDMVMSTNDGIPYAVSLKNSQLMKDAEIDCEELYVLVKRSTSMNDSDVTVYEDAVAMNATIAANNLIK